MIENSTTKKWLILGSSGLLGRNMMKYLKENGQSCLGTFNTHPINEPGNVYLNLFDEPLKVLEENEFEPDYILNTISLTNVDECETSIDLAKKLNIDSVTESLKLCSHFNHSKLIQLSTDQVHDGSTGNFLESDEVSPINVYGETKVEGEKLALSDSRALVCRTNFYGNGPAWRQSFSDWLISNLQSKTEISLFTDNTYNPLALDHLCDIIFKLAKKDSTGLFHTCGPDTLSKYEFGIQIAENLNYDSSTLKPITVKERNLAAKRPLKMSLNIDKLCKTLDSAPPGVVEGIKSLL